MNKKGFTLVELLAVIVILGLLMTIAGTKGFGAFDNTKKAIDEEQTKNITEAVKILISEVNTCQEDDYVELKKYFKVWSRDPNSCIELKENINGLFVSLKDMEDSELIDADVDITDLQYEVVVENGIVRAEKVNQ